MVSNLGRIKNCERTVVNGFKKTVHGEKVPTYKILKEKIIKTSDNGNGYLTFHASVKNKIYCRYVHRLVAEEFIEKKEGKKEVNHINRNKKDNNVKNLEWVDRRENVTHEDAHIKRGLKARVDLKKYEKIAIRRDQFFQKLKIRKFKLEDFTEIFSGKMYSGKDKSKSSKLYFYFKK